MEPSPGHCKGKEEQHLYLWGGPCSLCQQPSQQACKASGSIWHFFHGNKGLFSGKKINKWPFQAMPAAVKR